MITKTPVSLAFLQEEIAQISNVVTFNPEDVTLNVGMLGNNNYNIERRFLQIKRTAEVEEVISGRRPITDIFHYRLGHELQFSNDYSQLFSGQYLALNFFDSDYRYVFAEDRHEIVKLTRKHFERNLETFSLSLGSILDYLFEHVSSYNYVPLVIPANIISQYECNILFHGNIFFDRGMSMDEYRNIITVTHTNIKNIFRPLLRDIYNGQKYLTDLNQKFIEEENQS